MSDIENVEPWSETHEAAITDEEQLRNDRCEAAANLIATGCDHNCTKRWYDDLPLEKKIDIQKQNIVAAKLLGYKTSVEYFQAKLIALMEEQNGRSENDRSAEEISGANRRTGKGQTISR